MALTARKSPRYLGGATAVAVEPICSDSVDSRFELDESEIWAVDDVRRPDSPPARNTAKKPAKADYHHIRTGPRSVPVNVPDWSKILGGCQPRAAVSPESEGAGDDRLPPHEFLARTRAAPFSVTLKGSDLRRVRNAIWKKIGFED
ncbi:Protein of unknown function- DUF584 [Striga hermonthica]|uniref:Senescence regulator n=1 Tax=Striga hermonthica TaxID=68872 RepID=A0A9N7P0Q5_STRHE|nr:Protein of unknown function- DUF584 [Striga hermonthica]